MTVEFGTPGAFSVDVAKRMVRGLLVPWGEKSRPASGAGIKTEPIIFAPNAVTVPADVSHMNANMDHKQFMPMASFVGVEHSPAGLVGAFSINSNPEGDLFLEEYASGVRRKLSPEVRDIKRDATGLFATAVLTGAAFVTEGAFESAGLFAIDALGEVPEDVETVEVPEEAVIVVPVEPIDGVIEIIASEAPATVTVVVDETTTEYKPTTEPTEEQETPEVTDAIAPAAAFSVRRTPTNTEATSLRRISEALAAFYGGSDSAAFSKLDAADIPRGEIGMFALNNVTTAGTGAAILQPQWLGALWAGRTFQRRIIPLISHGDLRSFKVTGFRWTVDPAMATWAGDKNNVPSNNPMTEPYDVTAKRWAGGHDIAREFRDFNIAEFWDAYFAKMTDSYAKLTDDQTLVDLLAGATPVTAGAVPAGVNSGLVSIIDGALAVLPKGIPSFAVVAPDVYRSIALTKDIDKLAFLNTSLGLEDGQIDAFRVVPHIGLAAGQVLVGMNNSGTVFELPGSPIRTEALDQIKGGIDEALFGYSATVINEPASLALVTPAAA